VSGQYALGARFRRDNSSPVRPFDAYLGNLDAGDPTGGPEKLDHRDREHALAALFVGRIDAQDPGPGRPRIPGRIAVRRRSGIHVQLRDAGGALAVGDPEAVGRGVATTDDHHVLAGGIDRVWVAVASAGRNDRRQRPGSIPAFAPLAGYL